MYLSRARQDVRKRASHACMNELFFIADYVAKPHSEMKRSEIEL